MAIENIPGGGTMVTGKDDINIVRLLTLAHAAALEINTGMKASRIPLTTAARNCGVILDDGSRPQKKKILRLTVQELRRLRPDYEPSSLIAKALAK